MRNAALILALLAAGCADALSVEPTPTPVGAGSDVTLVPDAGTLCNTAYDCPLDTVCRSGRCVEVDCEHSDDACDIERGEHCGEQGLTVGGAWVCTQYLTCSAPWVGRCGPRAYCADDHGDECPIDNPPGPGNDWHGLAPRIDCERQSDCERGEVCRFPDGICQLVECDGYGDCYGAGLVDRQCVDGLCVRE